VADDIIARLNEVWECATYPWQRNAIDDAKAEIERLRRLGDTLAHHVRAGESKEMYSAVHAWEETRRG
jgi:hypothetical protein